MAQEYPWYAIVEGKEKLRQGDFFSNLPLVVPPANFEYDPEKTENIPITMETFNVVVLTQSCDLENEKIDIVQVCPYWSLEEISKENPFFKSVTGKESLRRGMSHGFHLLNKCRKPGFESDFLVVVFRYVFGVDYEYLIDFAKKTEKRLRLLPPYRERLSQEFAKFFMRVGMPEDIPQFK
jgi:hypothetical protein